MVKPLFLFGERFLNIIPFLIVILRRTRIIVRLLLICYGKLSGAKIPKNALVFLYNYWYDEIKKLRPIILVRRQRNLRKG